MIPYLAAFTAVVCYAAIGPVIKKTGLELPIFLFIGISSTLLALAAFFLLFLTQGRAGFVLPSQTQVTGFLTFTAINIVGWWLYMYAIKVIPVAQYDMIAGLSILLTAAFASLIIGEPIHLRYFPAALFIMLGLYIAIGPDLWPKR
jgi:drug/metabolite transporter (DMT)-like permease